MSSLFEELVEAASDRGKKIDLDEAVAVAERVHLECIWLLRIGSIFELANGYPTSQSNATLRRAISSSGEGQAIGVIRELAVRDAVMTAFRTLEEHASDRRSLSQIGIVVSRAHAKMIFDRSRAPAELAQPRRNLDWQFMKASGGRLLRRLDSSVGDDSRNLAYHREKLRGFRNNALAHSMAHNQFNNARYNELRDAIVFACACCSDALLLLKESHWDARDTWRRELAAAKVFWQRYESGFAD